MQLTPVTTVAAQPTATAADGAPAPTLVEILGQGRSLSPSDHVPEPFLYRNLEEVANKLGAQITPRKSYWEWHVGSQRQLRKSICTRVQSGSPIKRIHEAKAKYSQASRRVHPAIKCVGAAACGCRAFASWVPSEL